MAETAADVMTREVLTVTPATSITRFARLCAEDNVSGCPVVTVDGRLVGVVSKTDLLDRLLEGDHNFAASRDFRRLLGLGEEGLYAIAGSAQESEQEVIGQVDDIMQRDLVTVAPDATIAEVARRMADERVHRILVTDGDRLEGIITSLDMLAHFPR